MSYDYRNIALSILIAFKMLETIIIYILNWEFYQYLIIFTLQWIFTVNVWFPFDASLLNHRIKSCNTLFYAYAYFYFLYVCYQLSIRWPHLLYTSNLINLSHKIASEDFSNVIVVHVVCVPTCVWHTKACFIKVSNCLKNVC